MSGRKPHVSRKSSKKPSRKGVKKNGQNGKVICGARNQTCPCGHRYTKEEYPLEVCPQCARSRFCTQDKLAPNGRCRKHGGKTPTGPASPHFKHGGYSQAWENLGLKDYHERARESDLLDATEAMASIQARIWYVLGEGHGGALYRKLQESWKLFKERGKAGDKTGQQAAGAWHDSLIAQGADEADRWDEYYKLEEQLDRMRHRAHQRMVEGQLLVKLDLVIRIIGIFVFAVKAIIKKELESIGHPTVARSISGGVDREFKRLFGGRNNGSVDGRGRQETNGGEHDPDSRMD